MQLFLIRHGDAGAYTSPDSKRQLSALGQSQVRSSADFISEFSNQTTAPTLIISSPYDRAAQTADLINQRAFEGKLPHLICQNITPEDKASLGIDAIDVLIERFLAGDGDLIYYHQKPTNEHLITPKNGSDIAVIVVCHMNIIAKMAQILSGDDGAFALAEVRILDGLLAASMMRQCQRFIPTSP